MNEAIIQETSENNIAETVTEEISNAVSVFDHLLNPIKEAAPTFILAAVCAVIGFTAIKILMRIIGHALNRSEMDGIASGFLGSVIKIVLYVLLAVILLSLLHVPMDSIVAVIVSGSMAVALALKDSLANVAGGFILSFAKPVKAGDVVEISGSKGRVESVDMLYTKIVTYDNVTVYIPNGKVTAEKIINYTDKEKRRVDLSLCISYEDDIDLAKRVISETALKNEKVLREPAPVVYVNGHGDSSVELVLRAWAETEDYWEVYHALLESVKKSFDREGITIPYPQIDVHHRQEKQEGEIL
ncbi:MAG: mechanosensitive ion channel family protein [Ruminococcus sp.]